MDSNQSFNSNGGKANRRCFDIEKSSHASVQPSMNFRGGVRKGSEGLGNLGRSFRFGSNKGVFPEDLKVSEKKIFNPQDQFLQRWNKLFFLSCFVAVSVDPLFFYLPVIDSGLKCLGIDEKLAITTTTIRTIVDVIYLIRMILQFRTAYIAPSSRVFGRGELVIDPAKIAKRYLQQHFIIDLLSVLPIPQVS